MRVILESIVKSAHIPSSIGYLSEENQNLQHFWGPEMTLSVAALMAAASFREQVFGWVLLSAVE